MPVAGAVTVIGTSNGIQHLSNGTYKDIKTGKVVTANSLGEARNLFAGKPAGGTPAPQVSTTTTGTQAGQTPGASIPADGGAPVPEKTSVPVASTNTDIKDAAGIAAKTDYSNPNQVVETGIKQNADISQKNTIAQNPDINGPHGSSIITYGPDGQPTVTNTLNSKEQGLYDAQKQTGTFGANVAGGLAQSAGGYNQNFSNAQSQYAIPQVDSAYMQKGQDAAYAGLTRGLDDAQKTDTENQAQQLQNRGIGIGTDAYNKAMKAVSDRYDNQRLAAQNQAYQTGTQEAATQFGLANTAHQTAISDVNSQFGNNVSGANTLNGLSQVQDPQNQTFQSSQQNQIDPTTGATIQTSNAAAKIQQSQFAQTLALAKSKAAAAADPTNGITFK